MRLPCPVGHYGLLSILGGSARPPSLLTPPCVDRRGILQHLYSTALLPRPSCVPFVTFAHPGGQVCLPWLLASPTHPPVTQAGFIYCWAGGASGSSAALPNRFYVTTSSLASSSVEHCLLAVMLASLL